MKTLSKYHPGIFAIFALSLLPGKADAYDIERHFQANHCEFYVEVFGLGEFMHGETTFQSIDIDMRVNLRDLTEQKHEILAAGAEVLKKTWSARLNGTGEPVLVVSESKADIAMSDDLEAGIYKMRHSFARITESMNAYDEVKGLAFYIDVRREDGSVVRLWQTDNGRLFTINEIFREPPAFEQPAGIGVVHYPARTSPIYYQRSACWR